MMERRIMLSTALLFALCTFFLWGTTNFVISYGEKTLGIDPTFFTAVMWMTMGALGVALLAYLALTQQLPAIDSKVLYPVLAGVFLGVGLLTFAYALSHGELSTGATAAVATSNAVFTTLLAVLILRESMTMQEYLGIGMVVLGIIVLRI